MIDWKVEDCWREFGGADLQLAGYTRGGALLSMVEGAREYVILDSTDDGKHVSHLQFRETSGRSVLVKRTGRRVLLTPIIATATFDNLDAAKAQAEKWESMPVEEVQAEYAAYRRDLRERRDRGATLHAAIDILNTDGFNSLACQIDEIRQKMYAPEEGVADEEPT